MKKLLTSLILLTSIISTVSAYDAVVDGIYYNLNTSAKTAEVTESGTGYYAGNIVIPDTITYQEEQYAVFSIGKKAFYQNSTLTSVSIPSTVTRVCDFAFAYCDGLTSLTLPEGIDSIGNYAFAHSGITHPIISGHMFAYLPESYTGRYVIPDSITHICGAAFTTCTGLTGVTFPDSLQFIGYSAFGTCSSLGSVVIPNSVTYIGDYAFNECYSLTSVTLPENIDRINECTFYSCLSLTRFTVPATVKSIGRFAFSTCESLSNVTSYAVTPPSCGSLAFDYIAEDPSLLVPSGCSSAYKRAAEWSTFSPRIYEMGGAKVCDAASDHISLFGSCGHILIQGAGGQGISVYSAEGKLLSRIECANDLHSVEIPGGGIYFVRFSDGSTERIVIK